MANELVPQNLTGGALTENDMDGAFSGGPSYLSRMQLFGAKSDACAEAKIGIGHHGLVDDGNIIDLGEEVEAVIISCRPKALQIDGDNIITEHDPTSEMYAKIKGMSFVSNSGCMFGPEFLLWIPSQNTFTTYFMSSKTARREAKKIMHLVGCAATFKCHLIDNGKYKWHGPIVIECSTPLEVPGNDVIHGIVESFKNPPKSEIEVAPDDNSGRAQ